VYIVFTCCECIRLRESQEFARLSEEGHLVCIYCSDVEVEYVEYSQ
jgi:hypothetical protein